MAVTDIIPTLFDNYLIKLIFLVHALLISAADTAHHWGFGHVYNAIFLVSLLLSIVVDKNSDIILVTCLLNALSVILDIQSLLTEYVSVLGILLSVLNLVLRPVTTIMLLKNFSARAGLPDPTSGLLEVHVSQAPVQRARSAYQNIDEPNQTLP